MQMQQKSIRNIESAFSETFSILVRAEELVLREIVFDE